MPQFLLPIAGLIRRELVSSLRQSKFFYVAMIAVAIAICFVFGLWPKAQSPLWMMRNSSEAIFISLAMVLAGGAALIVPALAGNSVVVEREEETFELLAMTRARPWHVLLAKLVNSAGHYLLIVVALAPVAAAAFMLVGLNIELLLRAVVLISATALACAAAGVCCSCVLRNPLAAIGVSYLAMLTIVGLPMLLVLAVFEMLSLARVDPFLTDVGMYVMPMIAIIAALGGGPSGSRNSHAPEVCSALCVALALMLLLVAHLLVRRHWGKPPGEISAVASVKPRIARPRRAFAFPDGRNPVLLRELAVDYAPRGWMRLLLFIMPLGQGLLASALIIVTGLVNGPNWGEGPFIVWQVLQSIILAALFVAVTANMFTKEIERGNLDALRMSLLSADQIFLGKIAATFRIGVRLFFVAIAGLALALAFSGAWIRNNYEHQMPYAAASIVLLFQSLLLTWAATTLGSLFSRKTATSLVGSYLLTTWVQIGWVVLLLTVSMGEIDSYVEPLFAAISPYVAYAMQIDDIPQWNGGWLASIVIHSFEGLVLIGISAATFVRRYAQED